MELSDYQRDIIIRTVLGEARGEGDIGMAAVAHNILNRSKSRQFPNDPASVALQPKQYSVWNEGAGGGKTNFAKGSDLYKRAGALVDAVFSGQIPDMTGGALYYHTPGVNPNWSSAVNKHGTSQIGNHIFYHGRPVPPGELPQVGTLTDTVPPARGVPVTASPDLQALRDAPRYADVPSPQARPQTAMDILRTAPMGTPDMGPINALYAPQVAERAPITDRDLFFDRGIADTIAGTQAIQQGQGGLAAALEQMLRPQARTAADMASIYAQGGPTRPQAAPQRAPRQATAAEVAAAGAGAPWTAADGPAARLASAPKLPTASKKPTIQEAAAIYRDGGPTRPVARAATPMPTNVAQSYAGQEGARSGGFAAPRPTAMSDALAVSRAPGQTVATVPTVNRSPTPATQSPQLADSRMPWETIATVPTVQTGGVGKPPATKVVQSVPVNTAPKTAQTVPKNLPQNTRSRDSVAAQQAGQRTAAMFGTGNAKELVATPAKPNPIGYGSGQVKDDNIRLAGGIYPAAPGAGSIAAVPAAPPIALTAAASIPPLPRPRPVAVGTQLSVVPAAMRNVPRPIPRPQVARQAPLRVTINGAGQLQGPSFGSLAPRQPTIQQQAAQMAAAGLLNAASAQALASGGNSYVAAGGGLQPLRAMNGNIRYTYGDSSGSGGGSLVD